MTKSTIRSLTFLAAAAALLTSWSNAGENAALGADGPKTVSEGVDTKCEITGYEPYQGQVGSYFLSEGDKVAVISPSQLPTRAQADATVEGLKKWGFVPVEGKYVCPPVRTLDEQLADLEWALNDPEIKAIFCVRGGYGSTDAMDRLGADVIANARKPIIGYSDITVYHAAWTKVGLPSIHSSMSSTFTDLPEDCFEAEARMIKGEIPRYQFESPEECVEGNATGILIGGNLSTFAAVVGSAYDPTQTDKPFILFFEDVEEDIQHVHRYLTILKHLGVLDRAAGIVFGEWTDLPTDGTGNFGAERGGEFESVADMIRREILPDVHVPVAFGFPAGHGKANYPLLMGANVKLRVFGKTCVLDWRP